MEWLGWMATPEGWVALVTLVVLEIVLGVDNIIFISILVGRLPPEQRNMGRRLGLGFAMVTRILLLLSITWVMQLTTPLFSLLGKEVTGRDLILICGGLFLLWKSVHEIHQSMTPGHDEDGDGAASAARASFAAIIVQIAIIDIVFSLDSVITAVGMVGDIAIMIIAVVASVGVMMFAARPIGEFVDANPTIKILALSFLVVVGILLIAEGFGQHIPKGYVYFGMAFAFAVEMLNIRMRRNQDRIKLHKHMPGSEA
ncbi:MAG: TerC family protein [Ottowia sp.]|uniref:TerC family protein n=1 Tax=Ottowia sp. TaxID=1898956 RepID=UPI0039E46CB6